MDGNDPNQMQNHEQMGDPHQSMNMFGPERKNTFLEEADDAQIQQQ